MKTRICSMVIVLLLLLGASAAFARLASVGPINPNNNFPLYYVDTNGLALEVPTPPLGTALTVPPPPAPITPTMVFDPPIDGNIFSQQIGFGAECFYWVADADWTGVPSAVGQLVYRAGLEAAFATGDAADGQQIVFSRIRVRVKGLLPGMQGTYIVRHPYGTETIVVTADDIAAGKGLNLTRDLGVATLNFTEVLSGDVGPFLTQTAPIAFANLPPGYPVTGWIGDGATISPVTGSPTGFNQVSITPPPGVDLGAGAGVPLVTSNFVVSGHQFSGVLPTPLTMNRVTYTRNQTNTFFEIFATSETGALVNATIPGAPAALPLAGGANELTGLFYLRAGFANPFTIPANISITSQFGASTPTTILKQPVDLVLITKAVWHSRTKILTINANSGDTLLNPTLTVTDPPLGALVGGVLNFNCDAAPSTVTVSSTAGGLATADVEIVTP